MTTCLTTNGPSVYRTPSPTEELVVATADGVATLRRQSSGEWVLTNRALAGRQVSAVLREPRQGALFAGLHKGGVYASCDGGQTWQPRAQGIAHDNIFTLASIERDGQTILYAGTEPAHLFQSADYGESWQEVASLQDAPSAPKLSMLRRSAPISVPSEPAM